jgi:hypothetical protein
MAEGSRRRISYIEEVDWGVTPDTPSMKLLRNTGGGGIQMQRDSLQSQEYRSDRQIAAMRLGNKRPTLEVPFEFSFGSFDDLLEGALFGEWAVPYNLTAQTVSVNATSKTFSRLTGSWITDGVQVGDRIVTTGFDDSENNGTFLVSEVVALTITCATASGLKTVTGDTGVAVTTTRQRLKQGVTKKFYTVEEGFTDIDQHQNIKGAMVNQFSLSIATNAMVTGSFSLVGKSASAYSATPLDESPDAAPTTDPFDSYTGSITEGGSSAVVTAVNLSLANGIEALFACFADMSHRMGVGRANLSGSLSAFFEDAVTANKFLNETESALVFSLIDLDGNSYTFTIPRIKYTGTTKSVSENNVVLDYPWQALADSATATCFIIDKRPAA